MAVERAVKRIRDLIISVSIATLVFPICLLVALVVKIDSPGPILFQQTRIGYRGEPFTFYKFRTMRAGAEQERSYDERIKDFRTYRFHSSGRDCRVTRSGAVLRVMTIDELPQLINVVKGEMSLVGPRPELPEIVLQYSQEYHNRHNVKPGMTGLAAVMGRSHLTYHQMMECDLDYVDNHSFLRDLGIMAKTIGLVLTGRGAQ